MRFIDDNNAHDFWSRDHYADDPNQPLYNFDPEAEEEQRPRRKDKDELIDSGTCPIPTHQSSNPTPKAHASN